MLAGNAADKRFGDPETSSSSRSRYSFISIIFLYSDDTHLHKVINCRMKRRRGVIRVRMIRFKPHARPTRPDPHWHIYAEQELCKRSLPVPYLQLRHRCLLGFQPLDFDTLTSQFRSGMILLVSQANIKTAQACSRKNSQHGHVSEQGCIV